ncbi:MAG TPA: hypothetical protein VI299_05970 [Polyangiales bacterium]
MEKKTDWQRIVSMTLAMLSLGIGGVLAYDALDCCAPGAKCCREGAPCCHKHEQEPEG